ncbi:hypothetical protein NDU88_000253 [Pleurodeles waltl]|uniref:Uncharacterized protein n=1 Tax=Pleurodeles waltl TaxID=8319 RepID=A0AAV7L977_PLEWA|nr:hypothetical protein NDU88_000253 [Pleurodeles waltl]
MDRATVHVVSINEGYDSLRGAVWQHSGLDCQLARGLVLQRAFESLTPSQDFSSLHSNLRHAVLCKHTPLSRVATNRALSFLTPHNSRSACQSLPGRAREAVAERNQGLYTQASARERSAGLGLCQLRIWASHQI